MATTHAIDVWTWALTRSRKKTETPFTEPPSAELILSPLAATPALTPSRRTVPLTRAQDDALAAVWSWALPETASFRKRMSARASRKRDSDPNGELEGDPGERTPIASAQEPKTQRVCGPPGSPHFVTPVRFHLSPENCVSRGSPLSPGSPFLEAARQHRSLRAVALRARLALVNEEGLALCMRTLSGWRGAVRTSHRARELVLCMRLFRRWGGRSVGVRQHSRACGQERPKHAQGERAQAALFLRWCAYRSSMRPLRLAYDQVQRAGAHLARRHGWRLWKLECARICLASALQEVGHVAFARAAKRRAMALLTSLQLIRPIELRVRPLNFLVRSAFRGWARRTDLPDAPSFPATAITPAKPMYSPSPAASPTATSSSEGRMALLQTSKHDEDVGRLLAPRRRRCLTFDRPPASCSRHATSPDFAGHDAPPSPRAPLNHRPPPHVISASADRVPPSRERPRHPEGAETAAAALTFWRFT